jgi:nitrite reductase/ring-hydroxylating ferredoxin subunit
MDRMSANSEERRFEAARSDQVPEGAALRVQPPGRTPIALFRVAGQIYALDDTCTHGAASLSEGWLEGEEIECPAHQGRFCLRTGAARCFPLTQPVRTYHVIETDGLIYLAL